MKFYTIEQYEVMGDAMDEFRAWMEFEADMALNPYEDAEPTEQDIEMMFAGCEAA